MKIFVTVPFSPPQKHIANDHPKHKKPFPL